MINHTNMVICHDTFQSFLDTPKKSQVGKIGVPLYNISFSKKYFLCFQGIMKLLSNKDRDI